MAHVKANGIQIEYETFGNQIFVNLEVNLYEFEVG